MAKMKKREMMIIIIIMMMVVLMMTIMMMMMMRRRRKRARARVRAQQSPDLWPFWRRPSQIASTYATVHT